jgi:hypothetical protein
MPPLPKEMQNAAGGKAGATGSRAQKKVSLIPQDQKNPPDIGLSGDPER